MDKSFETYVFEDLCSALTFGRLGPGLHGVPDRDRLSIDIFETGPEGISDDSMLHKDSRKWPKGFVQASCFESPIENLRVSIFMVVMNFEDG